jgi:hypothetical protein
MYAIEKKAMLVESEYFNDVMYAIHKEGQGMSIICRNVELPILAENVSNFVSEILEVWQHMKPRRVML